MKSRCKHSANRFAHGGGRAPPCRFGLHPTNRIARGSPHFPRLACRARCAGLIQQPTRAHSRRHPTRSNPCLPICAERTSRRGGGHTWSELALSTLLAHILADQPLHTAPESLTRGSRHYPERPGHHKRPSVSRNVSTAHAVHWRAPSLLSLHSEACLQCMSPRGNLV